jgi:hypothetical protein
MVVSGIQDRSVQPQRRESTAVLFIYLFKFYYLMCFRVVQQFKAWHFLKNLAET